jgi:cyclase
MTNSLRVLRLTESLLGFYAGRTPGDDRDPSESWVDDGALSLGICSYAFVDGDEAIVYDTHVSLEHARLIRTTLEQLGVRRIRVVLSHWHLDHIAGNEVFADCEIIANRVTGELLAANRAAIEAGTLDGPPAIAPLVLPTTLFDGHLHLETASLRIELRQFDIHSRDATVIHVPDDGLLLAGDTVEDTVTYVSEPSRLELHIGELERMRSLGASRILPNHGSREAIERGGYPETLIDATQRYIRDLLRTAADPPGQQRGLREFVADQLDAGWITWFEPYERVHRSNLAAVSGLAA